MEPPRDDQMIADLQALRPTPRPQFATELDARAAAGFPRRSLLRLELPSLPPLHLLIPAGGVAAVLLAIVVAFSSGGGSESSGPNLHFSEVGPAPGHIAPSTGGASHAASNSATAEAASGTAVEAESTVLPSHERTTGGERLSEAQNFHHRDVERAAEITLAADPKDVDDDASRVFEAVHGNNGIVMRSSTQEGHPGEAGATFELLIPSARLDDAMAAFSDIDAVRSRHEATADITAPTVSAAELLKESRSRIDSLLAQLESAETAEEQEAIEAELRHERRHASRLAAQVDHLHKRADFSRVSLRIETGGVDESSGGGAWGIDDALHDAGHILTVAAAVTLIAVAVLAPIALIVLLAWFAHRAWVRRERRRVFS